MPYVKRPSPYSRRGALLGFGDVSDQTQCSQIPIGNPYRKPGNYCATPDGGITTFNADGSTYRAPGAVDPDPAHPAGSDTGSILGKIGGAILGALTPQPPVYPPGVMPGMVPAGMSTTTKVALAGGALLVVALIARHRG
jgi:hypothetical protein